MPKYTFHPNVKPFALAGGQGTRLSPLTDRRAKSAVPFGGKYTIIDPVLWSLYYSGLRDVGVLVQKNAVSLNDHIARTWARKLDGGAYIQVLPPEGFKGMYEYPGTAGAVYQHMHYTKGKDHVLVVAGDHLYKSDFSSFINFHEERDADLSIMAIAVPRSEAFEFGILGADKNGRVLSFVEKPADPAPIPGNESASYCSMGVYLFKTDVLEEYLKADANDSKSKHDFGFSILPKLVFDERTVYAYPFSENVVAGQKAAFWRDVGSIEAYWQEHMNLLSDDPAFNTFAEQWQLVTGHDGTSTFKTCRRVISDHSMGAGSTIVDLSELRYTVLGRRVHVRANCYLNETIVFDQVQFEGDCRLNKVIVDVDPWLKQNQRVVVPRGTEIGFSKKADEMRGFKVRDSGITIVPGSWFADKTITVD